jgi:uncharacterized PurR-regulated membrane protein YhhQ (DUF165 family)
MSQTKEVYENCANCGQFSKRSTWDAPMLMATFCCSQCRKEYYSSRPVRRAVRTAIGFFWLVLLVVLIVAVLSNNPR